MVVGRILVSAIRCSDLLVFRSLVGRCCRRPGRSHGLLGDWISLTSPRSGAHGTRGESQGGDPDLDVGWSAAHRHVRSRSRRPATTTAVRSAKTATTNVPGVAIGELLPLLAQQADKYSIIRSMTHGQNGHETASYMTQTGIRRVASWSIRTWERLSPSSKGTMRDTKGLIPPYIVLTQPQGRFSEAGFLGSKYKPFATGGDPGATAF